MLDDTFLLFGKLAKSAIWPVSLTKHGRPNHRFGYLVLENLTISNRHDSYFGVTSNDYCMKTVFDKEFSIQPSDFEFEYQKELTEQLDKYEGEFNQELINEIVLWKVNRYALVNTEVTKLLNDIDTNSAEIDEQQTRRVLEQLLSTKGIQLAMASTLLRFRNPHIYQIIDQRVFRLIYPDKTFKTSYTKSVSNISNQVEVYMDYLKDLRMVSNRLDIPFNLADRILFEADKRLNKSERLNNYGYGGL